MIVNCLIKPYGSVIAIADDIYKEMPEFDFKQRRHLWANDFCICVATLMDADGPTHLVVSTKPLLNEGEMAFDGKIYTPNGKITFSDANLTEFAAVKTPTPTTRIRIWTNHLTEPTEVYVCIS